MNADAALQRLIDKDQIRDVIMRYCRAVDRQDLELLLSLYHPGATEDHGAYKGPVAGFAEHLLKVMRTQYEVVRHSIGTVIIEIDGASAFVESSFDAGCILRQRTPDGKRQARVHSGRYLDKFERRDGVWAIANRIVVKDYIEFRPISDESDGYPVARSDREDLVYRLRAGTAAFAP
jgi:hypothetical protein